MITFDNEFFREQIEPHGLSGFARKLAEAKGRHVSPQQVATWASDGQPTGENLVAISKVTGIPADRFYKEVSAA